MIPDLPKLTTEAVRRTIALLFGPFRWSVWLRLALVGFLAGQISFSCSANLPSDLGEVLQNRDKQAQTSTTQAPAPGSEQLKEELPLTYRQVREGLDRFAVWRARNGFLFWGILGLALLFFFGLTALFLWLNARFSFVLIEMLTSGVVSIGEPFRRNGAVGNSYFQLLLALAVLSSGGMLAWMGGMGRFLLSLWAATPDLPAERFLVEHWPIFLGNFGLFLLWILAAVGIGFFAGQLVVPVMFARRRPVWLVLPEAFKLLAGRIRAVALYVLWLILLNFVLGMAFFLLMIGFIILAVIGIVILAGAAALVSALPTPLQWIFGIIGVLLLVALAFLLWGAGVLIQVPLVAAFKILNLRFLEDLEPGYRFFPAPADGAPEPPVVH